MNISDDLLVEGMARAMERLLADDGRLADRVAEAICRRLELMTPEEAAAMLGVHARTLGERHRDWGLDKSVTFGATNPRYFLSQVLARAQARVVEGRRNGSEVRR
jgi:hypothetical protein